MSKNKEVMIDIETLSTRGNAIIASISAVKFDRSGRISELDIEKGLDIFDVRIDIDSCEKLGMHKDDKTIEWWKKQDKGVYDDIFNKGNRKNISDALKMLSKWYEGCDKIWSQGASFDIPILSEAYSLCNIDIPWKFYNIRDTRTIYDLANVNTWDLPKGKEHNSLYDCYRQIYGVQTSYKKLSKIK